MIINDNWKIESDDLNVTLMRKRHRKDKEGIESWECFYYSTIAGALQGMLEKGIKETQLKDIKAINDKIEQVKQDINNAFGKLTKNML
jgi:hypothetical protein